MHTCISSHRLKRSWRSCPRRVNAGNKNTPSTHHPWRRNVTTLMVGLKKWSHTQKSHPKVVNPRDIAGERQKKKKNTRNKNTPCMHLRQRQNVTATMVGFKTQSHTQKSHQEWWNAEIYLRMKKNNNNSLWSKFPLAHNGLMISLQSSSGYVIEYSFLFFNQLLFQIAANVYFAENLRKEFVERLY